MLYEYKIDDRISHITKTHNTVMVLPHTDETATT